MGRHLTWNDRLVIERMLLKGYKPKQIAEVIGCCTRTIYYEIKRSTYMQWKELQSKNHIREHDIQSDSEWLH